MFLEPVSLWQLIDSHLCFVAHLYLQKAAWMRILIRCAHLRINPFEYYNNIWQTSPTEWWTWPTAWHHWFFDFLHMVEHIQDLPIKYPVWIPAALPIPQTFSSFWHGPVGYGCITSPFATYNCTFKIRTGDYKCLVDIYWSPESWS